LRRNQETALSVVGHADGAYQILIVDSGGGTVAFAVARYFFHFELN